VKPELTEGPYFVDTRLERSDIRSDPTTGVLSEGLPLAITYLVSRIEGSDCAALEGALVDIWHCDAEGVYSGVQDPRFDTSDQAFLRGYQVTDASGMATFQTIYPGWYSGRAVHIHFKIRTDPDSDSGLEFTSQLFFDDALSAAVYAQAPYADKGTQDVPNSADGIFRSRGPAAPGRTAGRGGHGRDLPDRRAGGLTRRGRVASAAVSRCRRRSSRARRGPRRRPFR
jgi:protocatechuate 3,4-dioxygenase beta subunit